ncbi:MAG: type 11 methyltransferase, partial [Chloroflexi bacterium]|nr:type 11 methyltransferase [Chloroflexota bacterium]
GAYASAFAARAAWTAGIDLDTAALTRGRARFPNITLVAASCASIPFADGSFDCVVFSEVLEHIPAELEVGCIDELRRVMCKGGTLILTTPHHGTFWWIDPLMAKTHLRSLAGRLRGNNVHLKGHKHYDLGEIAELLTPQFELIHIERPGWVLYPLAYWGHLLPFGIGALPILTPLWQKMMDADYSREHGAAAYNLCVIARAR